MLSEVQIKNSKPKDKKYLLNEARKKRDGLQKRRKNGELISSRLDKSPENL